MLKKDSAKSLLQQLSEVAKSHAGHAEVKVIDDDLKNLELRLTTQEESIHQGATYVFGVRFLDQELLDAHLGPHIWSKIEVFHPNIDSEGVCCNLLDDEWCPGTTLEAIIASLFCLLENPGFDSPLNDDWWYSMYPDRFLMDDRYPIENYQRDLKAFIEKNYVSS